MLMAELVKESADIIHEMTPTQDQMNEIGIEIFTPNYAAPKANEHNWVVLIWPKLDSSDMNLNEYNYGNGIK